MISAQFVCSNRIVLIYPRTTVHLRPTFGWRTVVKPVLWFYPVQKGNHWKQPCRFSANAFPAQRLIRQLNTWSWDHFPAQHHVAAMIWAPWLMFISSGLDTCSVRDSIDFRFNQIINSRIENSSGFNHHPGCFHRMQVSTPTWHTGAMVSLQMRHQTFQLSTIPARHVTNGELPTACRWTSR